MTHGPADDDDFDGGDSNGGSHHDDDDVVIVVADKVCVQHPHAKTNFFPHTATRIFVQQRERERQITKPFLTQPIFLLGPPCVSNEQNEK